MKQKLDDVIEEIREENDEKTIEHDEEIKINDDIEMLDSKEEDEESNNISINKSNTEHIINFSNPSKSKSIPSENLTKEKEEDDISFPIQSEFLPCREKEQTAIYKYIKTGISTKGNY